MIVGGFMLEIKNFSKKYGDKEAVSSLSFVVNDGDIMGFVGKNGAGKTTTLKACMGIITLTEGDILLDGISVVKDPIVCKRSMAYVPDTPRLEEYMTGMIIFFDWDNKGSSGPQDGQADHVGIVQKVENGIVYTVEGNSGDSCRVNQYPVGYYEILGYGVAAY